MRRAVILVLAIVTIAVFGCQPAEKAPEKPRVTIPKGKVLVGEAALRVFVDQAEIQMQAAQTAVKKRDSAGAARSVRLAVGFMRLESAQAKGQFRKAINRAAADLQKLAASLEKRETVRSDDLSAAFARAQYALARHHRQKAGAALGAAAAKKASHRLAAAAAAIEAADKWAGVRPTSEDKAAVLAARVLAQKIAQGETWTQEEAAPVLSGLQAQIDKLKATVEPAASAGTAPAGGGK